MELFSLTANTTVTDIQWQAYPIGFVLSVLCIFTIMGNLFIIIAIVRVDKLHKSKYYYIASLAFADLLVGLIAMPFAFIFEMTDDEYWLFPRHLRFLCDFWHSMDIFVSAASIFGLSAVGVDRYVAITKAIKYPNSFICKRWYYILLAIWICAAVISFPAVSHFGTEQVLARRSSTSNETKSTVSLLFKECDFPNNPYYILFVSVVSFYLPLLVMIFVYIRVYSAAEKQIQALHSGYKHQYSDQLSKSFIPKCSLRDNAMKEPSEKSAVVMKNRKPSFQLTTLRIHHGKYRNPSRKALNHNNEDDNELVKNTSKEKVRTHRFWKKVSRNQKAGKFVGIVMGVFVFCWLPYFVYFILSGVFDIRLKDDKNHELLFKILSWLGYSNSALDVLVYIFTSKELRAAFLKLCCKS